MRFRICFFGVDILEMDFMFPSRGIYEVPENIFSELELEEFDLFNKDFDPEGD